MKSLSFLSDNLWLKLLALVLAIALYHAVKQSLATGGNTTNIVHEQQRTSAKR
jgi:hypothetical protein